MLGANRHVMSSALRPLANDFDIDAAQARCRAYRRRILDISRKVSALHIAPAYSCMEIVDCLYSGLMRRDPASGAFRDIFLMSKGHGCMAQYVMLEAFGILATAELERYCTKDGLLGAHPDYGNPGIAAATGSLGHGLGMAVGMAVAERNRAMKGGDPARVYTVLSDGEVQEGSTWESVLMAPTLKLDNLIAVIDSNDFQSLGRTSETHPPFYPLAPKFAAFGWEVVEVNGHDAGGFFRAVTGRKGGRPLMVIAKTVKGRGVKFMESVPIWHYRAPSADEYKKAIEILETVAS